MPNLTLDYTALSLIEKLQLDQLARFYAISHAETALLISQQHLGGIIAQHFEYLAEHNPYFSDFIERQGGENA